jgi:hypothetical protein
MLKYCGYLVIDGTVKSRQCRIAANYVLRSTLLKNSESFFKTITPCELNCLTRTYFRRKRRPTLLRWIQSGNVPGRNNLKIFLSFLLLSVPSL